MTTHSSVLAWEIPWTEKPGGLQSMGLHRVGHNGAHTECWSLVPVALQETTPGRWRELGSQLEGLDLHTSHPHLRLGNLGFPGGSDGKESACSAG